MAASWGYTPPTPSSRRRPAIRRDPFFPYVTWMDVPSAYGPAWELIAGAVARLAGDGVLANVLAFKLLGGAFLAANVGVLWAILRQHAPDRARAACCSWPGTRWC